MKKINFLVILALVMVFMASCADKSQYTINGVAGDYPDGTTVYLMMRQKPEWLKMDSATVQDGKFQMKGQVDPGYLGYIGVGDEHIMIVVEPGEITIDLKEGNPHGTENNEKLSSYNDEMKGLDAEMEQISAQMEGYFQTDSVAFQQCIDKLNELGQKELDIIANVIRENITNPLGVGFFCFYNSIYADNIDFLVEMSEQIPEAYLQQPYVTKVMDNVNIIRNTTVGSTFTDLEMTTRKGEQITLKQLVESNRYVLVDFWASWCSPCCQSLPGIHKLYEDYKDAGLCIVGISLDEKKESWEAALEKYDMTWIQVSDLKGWDCEYAAAYGVRAIPATVLIDSTGKIVGRNLEASQIEEILRKEIEETAQE